jgi:hypothetical protein
MNKSNVMADVNDLVTFSNLFITCNFSTILVIFSWFYACIAVGVVNVCAARILVTEANAVEGGTTQLYITNIIHIQDWWQDNAVTFCYPPTQDRCGQGLLCQITLKQKLSHIYVKPKITTQIQNVT